MCIDEVITKAGKEITHELAVKLFTLFDKRFSEKYKDLPDEEYRVKESECFRNYLKAYYGVEIK